MNDVLERAYAIVERHAVVPKDVRQRAELFAALNALRPVDAHAEEPVYPSESQHSNPLN
ncbi:hypothetical protein [Streptomyces sp. SID12488]|uniref:hypothetical protein n=1 Tax=Streptomyces sp. SID12488 TaxID=2706040 RepID=UPI0013DBCB2A|nr:hypothetical protein [Streptomyces sp. SID12488]NEA61201.1 hypothetical protein [Streptomyces sp. SID12488]